LFLIIMSGLFDRTSLSVGVPVMCCFNA
jgi:hypothetical protein